MAIATEPKTNGSEKPRTLLSTIGRAPRTVKRTKIRVDEVNKANCMTPRVERLKERLLATKSGIASDRAWYGVESLKLTEGEHPCKRRAKAFANILAKMPIFIRDDELLVGQSTPFIRGAHPAVELGPLHFQALLKGIEKVASTGTKAQEADIAEEDLKRLQEATEYLVKPENNPTRRVYEIFTKHAGGLGPKLCEARLMMGGGALPSHLAPGADYGKVLDIGVNGIIAEAKEEIDRILRLPPHQFTIDDREKLEFLESAIITLEGIIRFAKRHADLAREMAAKETDPVRKKELEKIAEVCDWVPANPARSFHEALQSTWFITVGHDIEKAQPNAFLARMDQYLYPTYEKDVIEGNLSVQDAAELLGCLFLKIASLDPFLFLGLVGKRVHQDVAQANYIANITLGGIHRDGSDASNELSCLILQVAKQVKTHQPHISLRWHRAMAPELLEKAIECTRDNGAGIPAWFNDRAGIEYLLDRDVSYEDARDWAICGCINIVYPKSFSWDRSGSWGFINHAKLLEMALNDGIDPRTGHRLGPATGDPRTFKTFDDLITAYKTQIDHYYDFMYGLARASEKAIQEDRLYYPFVSSLLEDCIKNGKDCSRRGGRYQQLEAFSVIDRAIPDAADSLTAIKKVVYEGGVPMSELLDALKADFEGYDELRQKLLAAPKFGNDDDEADAMTAEIWDYTKYKALSYRDSQNRRPCLFRQGAAWAQWAGRTVGALPNGRKAWTTLADASASPVQGCDVKGPTAAFNSVAKLDPMYMEGPLLNMKFSPGVLASKEGRDKFANLVATYMDQGGFHVQFNVLDQKTLLAAKKNPEKYRNLVVRVAGYSAFWVELTPEVQDEIIYRTEQHF